MLHPATTSPLSPETRQILTSREQQWQGMSEQQRAAWAALARLNYQQARNEVVTWFPAPVTLGTRQDVPAQVLVALGISRNVEPATVEALIVAQRGAVGTPPALLGRLLKFSPFFQMDFEPAALRQLATDYGLIVE